VEPVLSRMHSQHSLFKTEEIYKKFNQDVRDSAEFETVLLIGRYIWKKYSVVESNCNMTTHADK
jgi:hypothetical protein